MELHGSGELIAPSTSLELPNRQLDRQEPDLSIFNTRMQEIDRRLHLIKKIFDCFVAMSLLLVTSPIFATIAALIWWESAGPIFFRQPRLGYNNEIFTIYKFRTMFHDQDQNSLDGSRQARRDDPRVTRIGGWLRKYSIDELPQLINVMKGEMSLVGPRPHPLNVCVDGQPFHEVVPDYAERHRVLPGITGWAQVNGWRGETIIEEQIKQRVAHDLYYIENWSLAFDIRILLLTLVNGIFNEGAF